MAFAVTHWVFGEIHLMTLVFGASLIGVCVDFSFLFYGDAIAAQKAWRFSNFKTAITKFVYGFNDHISCIHLFEFYPISRI